LAQDWLLFLLTTLLYPLLIHKSKQKQKNTTILAPKFVIFLFVYIFSVFFPPKNKIPSKARKKGNS
jgi:hypothetical protein